MTQIATVCPVWQEVRFLPLVLEQMSSCPGPKLLLHQNQPLYWLDDTRPAPSGFGSKVTSLAKQFPSIEVIQMEHAPKDGEDAPFGGFASLALMAFDLLATRGVEVVVWMDSDWLCRLTDLQRLYTSMTTQPERYWSVQARHYWRDFNHTMATTPITIGFPIHRPNLWHAYDESEITRSSIMCYHPAYVMTDGEMLDKTSSWGHAPLFKERKFFEKEWIGGDDSLVNPQPADVALPTDILDRLLFWGSLDGLKDPI